MSSPMKDILLILSAIIIYQHGSVYGQKTSYVLRHITSSPALTGEGVTSIIQDNKGFMWIGTTNGLQKFDGYAHTAYHHNPYDTQSISSDNITLLLKDRENDIWVLTAFSGFNRFNPSTEKNTRISGLDNPSVRDLDNSSSACLDDEGNAWLLSNNSIARYDLRQHKLVAYDDLFPKEPGMAMTKSIVYDQQKGNIWVNSLLFGVCMLDPKHRILYDRVHNPERLPVFDLARDPGTLYIDRDENLWMNTYSGKLYRYNLNTHEIKEYSFNDPDDPSGKKKNILIDCILQDKRGTIWMGARKHGLLAYSPATDSFRSIPLNRKSPGGLDYDEYLLCLCEDREGNIWIGTDNGVFLFNPYRQPFNSIDLPEGKNGSLNTTHVLALTETDDGDIWVATYGEGIHVFSNQLQYKATYSHRPGNRSAIGDPADHAWCFLRQPEGKIWVGGQHGWLSTYDPADGTFITSQPAAFLQSTIINMVTDSAQNIWLALYSGLARWDRLKKTFTRCPEIISNHGSNIRQVFDLLVDNKQNLWLATQNNGFQKFDVDSQRYTRMYVPDHKLSRGISDISVQCIEKVNDTLFALGTSSGGINLFNPSTDRFSYITVRDGLPSNNITALHFQAPNHLWVATSMGLCKVNITTNTVFHYGLEDGIVADVFNDCTRFCNTKDGRLLIGYSGGFVSFRPDSIDNKEPPEKVTITGFRVFDQPLLVDSILDKSDSMLLSYDHNFITINYASLSFLEPDRIKYYYKLQGVDPDWVKAGQQRFATYTNLSPGTYSFSVRCENREGIGSEQTTSLLIVILPPFWQTWWFKCLLVGVVLILLYGLYRYRINQLLKMQAMRNDISKDLHDDVGATLGSISILSEVARHNMQSGSRDQAYSLLVKISNNAKEMVDKMSDIVWAINPKNENLQRIVQRLTEFGLEPCTSKSIRMEIHADESSLRHVLPMEAVKNIYLLVKEAMNNAIKHADCKNLSVSFTCISSVLHISIADDGKGFDPQKIKHGNGLVNMESRVKEMKGDMSIRSDEKNTTVVFRMPIP
ncbi:MAG TPA: two-component regulator propeller domain-containing protein [Puia sp.]|nr:two-component regulator propeller domain-containing protein [Puia sp.]